MGLPLTPSEGVRFRYPKTKNIAQTLFLPKVTTTVAVLSFKKRPVVRKYCRSLVVHPTSGVSSQSCHSIVLRKNPTEVVSSLDRDFWCEARVYQSTKYYARKKDLARLFQPYITSHHITSYYITNAKLLPLSISLLSLYSLLFSLSFSKDPDPQR
jgi:hypothetical protein